MAEPMRCEPDADATTVILNARAQARGTEAGTITREEERRVDLRDELRSDLGEIDLERGSCRSADRHNAVLAAFAVSHQEHAAAEIDVADVGTRRFAEAEAGPVEQLEDRAVAQTNRRVWSGRGHQATRLGNGQDRTRQRPRLRQRQDARGIL